MKKITIALFFFFCLFTELYAQEYSLKYGKITNDELTMKVYTKDTTAAAVVLYDDGYASYEYTPTSGFKLEMELKKKVKILKQEGIDEATISIPYYSGNSDERESISGLDAVSYNMEDGKVVKTKLDKKYLFDEEISNNYRQMKFSIPNVKAGTVIEYKYKLNSGRVYSIPEWSIQSDIPVVYSSFEVLIPEYFIFNIETKGYENIKDVETTANQTFTISNGTGTDNTVTCQSRDIKFSAKEVPAL